jgi:hypothetical protein
MAKLNSKKNIKKSSFYKEKGLVGLTPVIKLLSQLHFPGVCARKKVYLNLSDECNNCLQPFLIVFIN